MNPLPRASLPSCPSCVHYLCYPVNAWSESILLTPLTDPIPHRPHHRSAFRITRRSPITRGRNSNENCPPSPSLWKSMSAPFLKVNSQLTILWSLYHITPTFKKLFFTLTSLVLYFPLFTINCSFFQCESFCSWMVCLQSLYPYHRSQSIFSSSWLRPTFFQEYLSVVFCPPKAWGKVPFHLFPTCPFPYFSKTLRSCTRLYKNSYLES